ncbi:MAG TPA: protein kinase [Longimicrobiales bacterium]|nr:protein kinase [Longimicrobiales bacterium]
MTPSPIDQLRELLPQRYDVLREIARGGMSRLYLARESHPDRHVVIKVMDGRLSDAGRERFLQEVGFTSELSHPHIVPIYAAGEVGASPYYVMPYIEGDTLADRIAREGPLPVDDAVRIASEVAGALHYAHERGVIHRDVKPDNIHFRDGHALVADFGVARAHGDVGTRLTAEGHTLGTVAYMAPEQVEGSGEVEGAADQYSLGCVLFEMLTGEPPFQGRTPQSTLARHLSGTVPPLRALRATVPEYLEAVVQRSLAKLPSDRYPSLAEFGAALRDEGSDAADSTRVSGGGGVRVPPTWRWAALAAVGVAAIAVALLLPGTDPTPTPDPTNGYLTSVAVLTPDREVVGGAPGTDLVGIGDALANEISSTLAAVPWLNVKSHYSVRVIEDARLSVPEILDTLEVEHLIQLSLVLQGERVGLGVGYIDADERQQPGPRRDFLLADWLDEQPRIAQAVAEDFTSRVAADQPVTLRPRDAPGPGYRDYRIGTVFLNRRTPQEVLQSIDAFWRAIAKDPDYGPAYSKLSQAYALALTYRYDIGADPFVAAGLAHELADRGIQESPSAAEGYAARGYLRALAGAPAELAARDIQEARRLEPNNPSVPSWSARTYTLQQQLGEAYEEVVRGAELDPLHSGRQIAVAYQAFHVGRHEVALRYSNIALDLEPALMLPRVIKARSLVLLGRPEECLAMNLGPHAGTRALCLWASGARDEAMARIAELADAYPAVPAEHFSPVLTAEDLAVFYGYTGDAREALRWIRTAYDASPTGVELRVLESDLFDPVRNSPGFQSAVDRYRAELWPRVQAAWQGPLRPPAGTIPP